jgi:aminoglycoside phosphotransferase (APT) family kinase protein
MTGVLDERLIAHLRAKLGAALDYDRPPTPLTGGYDAAILSFSLRGETLAGAAPQFAQPLVLRLMPRQEDGARVRREAATHDAVTAQGYPAPRVLDWSDHGAALGQPFLIMQRLAGSNLMAGVFDSLGGIGRLLGMPAILAGAHARLHALDPAGLTAAYAQAGFDPAAFTVEAELAKMGLLAALGDKAGFAPAVEWLHRHRPAPGTALVVCHGDFHPLNLVGDAAGPVGVVDWANAIVAEPEYDVGATCALMSFGPVSTPAWQRPLINLVRRLLVARYLAAYRAQRPLDNARLAYFEAFRIISALVLEDPAARAAGQSPWSPETTAAMLRRFGKLTGVRVAPPVAPQTSPGSP